MDNPGFGASDFMSRLVSRSAGKVLAIEPRLPSLFEPNQDEPPGLGFSEFSSEMAAESARAHKPAPDRSSRDQAEAHIDKRDDREWLAAQPAGILGVQISVNEIRDQPAPVPSEDGPGAHSTANHSNGRAPLNTPNEPRPRTHGAQPTFVLSESGSREHLRVPGRADSNGASAQQNRGVLAADDFGSAAPVANLRRSSAVAMDGTAREYSTGADFDAAPRRITARNISTGRPPSDNAAQPSRAEAGAESLTPERQPGRAEQFGQFAAAPSAARWRPPAVRTEARAEPMPEPVVNITIGRVEVRAAVSAVPQAQPQKRGAAPLSLEGYLQNKARGT